MTTLLLGGGATTNTVLDINNRGGTASQAFLGRLGGGRGEAVFEEFSLDAIVKPKNITGIKTFVKEFLRGQGQSHGRDGDGDHEHHHRRSDRGINRAITSV